MKELDDKFNRLMFKLGTGQRRRLYLKLAKMMENGTPILDALISIYQRRVTAGQQKHALSIALDDWIKKVQNGMKLSQAMIGWVDHDEQMLISAGEQSGNIDGALVSTAEIMVAKKRIRWAVIGGIAYPAFLLMLAFGLLVMFSYKIIPQFSRVVPDDKWQGIARLMINSAEFTRDWLPVITLILVGLIVAFFYSLPRWTDGLRIKLDRFIPYSIYRILIGSTWMISFAALVNAGVRIETALQQLESNSAPWLKVRIASCLRGMRSGLGVGDALAKAGYQFPDPEIIDDLGVYSKFSGFDQALDTIGREWITESVERIETLMKVVFGVSLLLVAALVIFEVGGLIAMELQMASIMQTRYR